MQDKKLTRAKIVIEALRQHYGEKVGEFAERLGVAPSTVSTWANRDSLDEDLIFRKCKGVRFEFLQTGEGEMFDNKFKEFSKTRQGDYPEKNEVEEGSTQPYPYSRDYILDEIVKWYPSLSMEEKKTILSYVRGFAEESLARSKKEIPDESS
jgi:transcriptional regulator with XRE-family HTH domain